MKISDVKFPQWMPHWARPVPAELRRAREFTSHLFGEHEVSANRIPGWLHPDQAAMLSHLARICPDGPVVEIGSFKGKSTVFIARSMKDSNTLTAIDPHVLTFAGDERDREKGYKGEETSWDAFNKTLHEWEIEDKVRVIRDFSFNIAKGWSERISFLWIDGDHRFESVAKDINDWIDFVVPGGFVGFHDTHPKHAGHGGPRRAIGEAHLLTERGFETFLELRNAWFFRRK